VGDQLELNFSSGAGTGTAPRRETIVTYLLNPDIVCPPEEDPDVVLTPDEQQAQAEEEADCRDSLIDHPVRVAVDRGGCEVDESLHLWVLLTTERHQVAEAWLQATRLELAVDLGERLEALERMGALHEGVVLSEDVTGQFELEIESEPPSRSLITISVPSDMLVAFTNGGKTCEVRPSSSPDTSCGATGRIFVSVHRTVGTARMAHGEGLKLQLVDFADVESLQVAHDERADCDDLRQHPQDRIERQRRRSDGLRGKRESLLGEQPVSAQGPGVDEVDSAADAPGRHDGGVR
jgi:hypothetical protein